jgi:hypothetical protein
MHRQKPVVLALGYCLPILAKAIPKLAETVVLPTPPLPEVMTIMRVMIMLYESSGNNNKIFKAID